MAADLLAVKADPRVGGVEITPVAAGKVSRGRSPRGRGRVPWDMARLMSWGPIPAWAG